MNDWEIAMQRYNDIEIYFLNAAGRWESGTPGFMGKEAGLFYLAENTGVDFGSDIEAWYRYLVPHRHFRFTTLKGNYYKERLFELHHDCRNSLDWAFDELKTYMEKPGWRVEHYEQAKRDLERFALEDLGDDPYLWKAYYERAGFTEIHDGNFFKDKTWRALRTTLLAKYRKDGYPQRRWFGRPVYFRNRSLPAYAVGPVEVTYDVYGEDGLSWISSNARYVSRLAQAIRQRKDLELPCLEYTLCSLSYSDSCFYALHTDQSEDVLDSLWKTVTADDVEAFHAGLKKVLESYPELTGDRLCCYEEMTRPERKSFNFS